MAFRSVDVVGLDVSVIWALSRVVLLPLSRPASQSWEIKGHVSRVAHIHMPRPWSKKFSICKIRLTTGERCT